jgi:hypothetical protein
MKDLTKLADRAHPFPWKHVVNRRKKMSAVVDAKGIVVCGSLICQVGPGMADTHAFIVDIVNWGAV